MFLFVRNSCTHSGGGVHWAIVPVQKPSALFTAWSFFFFSCCRKAPGTLTRHAPLMAVHLLVLCMVWPSCSLPPELKP